jgi:hypothetical protein
MLFGAIGYTILEKSLLFPNIKIILISDKHDEENKSCKSPDGNIVDSVLISDYLKELIKRDYILLLEEVPSNAELVTLWNDSEHVQSTRQLYLDIKSNEKLKDKIYAFDIRLDLVKNMSPDYYKEQILKIYLENIQKFFLLESDLCKELQIYTSNIDRSFLGKYYYEILSKYYFFIMSQKSFLGYKIKDIPNSHEIFDTIDLILSNIIEFYCIAKLFDLIKMNNKIVIYCGLYHTQNIKKNLIKYFKFTKITEKGIVDLQDVDKINQNCSDIPIVL